MITIAQHLRPWHELPIVAIDFETDGVNPQTCMPVEVAAVRFERGEPVAHWSSLINPGRPIAPEATAVHGITDADVMTAAAPSIALASPALLKLLEGALPCGYNGQIYDRVILHRFLSASGMERRPALHLDVPWVDPLAWIREFDRFVKGPGRHKLSTTCARWGVQLEDAHRARGDAEAAGRLLFRLANRIGDMTWSELIRLQSLHGERHEREFAAWRARQQPKPEGVA